MTGGKVSDEARSVLNAESHTDERRTRGPLRALGAMLRRTINRAREAIRVRLSRRGVEAPVGQVESLPAIQLAVEGTSRLLAANARLTTDWLPRREIPTRPQTDIRTLPYTWQLPRSPAEGFTAAIRERYLPGPPLPPLTMDLSLAPPHVQTLRRAAPVLTPIPGPSPYEGEGRRRGRVGVPLPSTERGREKDQYTPPRAGEGPGERSVVPRRGGAGGGVSVPPPSTERDREKPALLSPRRGGIGGGRRSPPRAGEGLGEGSAVPRRVARPRPPIGKTARAARAQARAVTRRGTLSPPTRRPTARPRPTSIRVPRFRAATSDRPTSTGVSPEQPPPVARPRRGISTRPTTELPVGPTPRRRPEPVEGTSPPTLPGRRPEPAEGTSPPTSLRRRPEPAEGTSPIEPRPAEQPPSPTLPEAVPRVTPASARRQAAPPATRPASPVPPSEVGPPAPAPTTRRPTRPTEAAALTPRAPKRQPAAARTLRFKPRIGQRFQRPRQRTRLLRAPAARPTEPGRPLPPPVRATMERVLGSDLGAVRVHTGPQAARAAAELRAEAFTTEQEIFFGAERARFETPSGLALLGHELAHVRQRMGITRPRIPSALRAQAEEEEAQQVEETIRRTLGPGPTVEPLTLLSAWLAGGPTQEGEAVRRTGRRGRPTARPIPAHRPARPTLELAAAPVGRAAAMETAPGAAEPVAPAGTAAEAGEEAAPPEVDVAAIAAQVYEIIKRRLAIERERSGRL